MEDRPAASPSYKGGSLDSAFRHGHAFNLHGDQPQPAMEQIHDHGIPPEKQIGQSQSIGIDWWYVTIGYRFCPTPDHKPSSWVPVKISIQRQ